MAQREAVRVLTGSPQGGLERYLQDIKPYVDPEAILSRTIQFRIPGTQYKGTGYEATLLLDICDAYLRAREADALLAKSNGSGKEG